MLPDIGSSGNTKEVKGALRSKHLRTHASEITMAARCSPADQLLLLLSFGHLLFCPHLLPRGRLISNLKSNYPVILFG